MNAEQLNRMGAAELRAYADIAGIDLAGACDASSMVAAIEGARNRTAHVRTLGLELAIPMKRLSDKRVADLLDKPDATDAEIAEAMALILGPEQMAAVEGACTDEDGTLDVYALATAFVACTASDELKN